MTQGAKHEERQLSTAVGLKAGKVKSEKQRRYWRRYWGAILFMWFVILLSQWLCSFVFTGWLGFILGIVFSVISFVIGFYAIERVLEKEIQYSG